MTTERLKLSFFILFFVLFLLPLSTFAQLKTHLAVLLYPRNLSSPIALDSSVFEEKRSIAFSAGMGLTYVNGSDVVDYISFVTSTKQNDFTSAVEFYGGPEVLLNSDFGLKLEYAYLFTSYSVNTASVPGTYQFSYAAHLPTAIVYRMFSGEGYYFKLGGGIGYHFGIFKRTDPSSNATQRYAASGGGAKLEIVGNTAFDKKLFAIIGVDLRFDFIGDLKDDSGKKITNLRSSGTSSNVTLNFVSFGVKFGLAYYF